jgi:hypothetical protein
MLSPTSDEVVVLFPHFQMKLDSHESCGVVVQSLDLDDAPSAWTAIMHELAWNEIELKELDDDAVDSYSFDYVAYMLD